jgi:hypothetical protein
VVVDPGDEPPTQELLDLVDEIGLNQYESHVCKLVLEKEREQAMPFEAFRSSKKFVRDLGERLQDESLKGMAGFLYLDALWIQNTTYWPKDAPGFGRGVWFTQIGRAEYQSDSLVEIERHLYQFAVSEGHALIR